MGGAVAPEGGVGDAAAELRKQTLNTKTGIPGLMANAKVFFIAMVACLGGFLYGYNQGVFSGVLAMNSFERLVGYVDLSWINRNLTKR